MIDLFERCSKGDFESIRRFVSDGGDANIRSVDGFKNTLLIVACETCRLDIVEFLIASNVEIDAVSVQGNSAIMKAALNACPKAIDLLLHHGASVQLKNENGKNILHLLDPSINSILIDQLIANGADVNCPDKDKQTPIFRPIVGAWVEGVKSMVRSGADVNAVDRWGNNPLFLACERAEPEIASILIEAGAAVNWVGEKGETIVHKMIASDFVDEVDEESFFTRQGEIARLLLLYGFDPNIRDRYGVSALDAAREANCVEVCNALIKRLEGKRCRDD